MNRYIFLLLVLLLLAMPVIAQDSDETPPYAHPGSYTISKTLLRIPDPDGEGSLLVALWYPAKPGSVNQLPIPEAYAVVNGDALIKKLGKTSLNGAPTLSSTPYPLVIIAPGSSCTPVEYLVIEEHLASWGFVVATPFYIDYVAGQPYGSVVNYLIDIKRTTQAMDLLTVEGGLFDGIIDMQQIAVVGHSAGGAAAFGAGGASLNWKAVEKYCTTATEDAACENLPHQLDFMIELLGTEPSPDGNWSAIYDERVKSVVSLAGFFELYGSEGLADITVPIMLMRGTDDEIPSEWFDIAYDYVSSSQKAMVLLEGAKHWVFSGPDWVWKAPTGYNMSNHFMTAFLLDVLKGDPAAHAALSPDTVSFPGIEYKAQGF